MDTLLHIKKSAFVLVIFLIKKQNSSANPLVSDNRF